MTFMPIIIGDEINFRATKSNGNRYDSAKNVEVKSKRNEIASRDDYLSTSTHQTQPKGNKRTKKKKNKIITKWIEKRKTYNQINKIQMEKIR